MPSRALRHVVYDEADTLLDDTFNATGSIDGQPLLMRKAYNTIVPSRGRFIGHWADVTPLIRPGTRQTLTLQLPGKAAQGVFFDNVETILTDSFTPAA